MRVKPKSINTKRRLSIKAAVIISIFVVALLAIVTAYNSAAQTYNRGVVKMRDGVKSATQELLGPLGGIEHRSITVLNGDFSNSFLCIDVNCPDVQSQWYLLADKNQQDALKKDVTEAILKKSGDSKWSANVIVGVLGKNERPYDTSSGKEWFNISIFVTYAPKTAP